ncbi:helix-turn-helix transcriptional regulator [Niabella insulamsoli]|uniref:helix-turn-helix transcriptional regulator n=1 Tax=Niabella insulamsoli TaxID=3144874 RepID=UPI0031FBFA7B
MSRLAETTTILYNQLFEVKEHEVFESHTNELFHSPDFDFYELSIKDLHFSHISNNAPQKSFHALQSKKAYISFVCSLKGRQIFVNRNAGKVFANIHNNQSGLLLINNQIFDHCWEAQNGAELYIINMTIAYFTRFLPAHHPLFELLESSIKENAPVLLGERVIEITPKMKSLLLDILLCEYNDNYKALYLKSRFIELLMLQLREYEINLEENVPDAINDANLRKMHEAREFIDANLEQPCSLVDLALQVGTNECYLKKHFKQAFGNTVYGYLHQQRMERSKEILMRENKKISEVAKLSGYKHTSHFSSAFKKYFGYLPNKIKLLIPLIFHSSEWSFVMETSLLMPL